MSMTDNSSNVIVALPPPPPPGDLISAAKFIPLHEIEVVLYKGKKIRLIGQILAYHAPSSLLLLTSSPNPAAEKGKERKEPRPHPTLLVDLSIPLLGQSPSVKDISSSSDSVYSRQSQSHIPIPVRNGNITENGGDEPYINRQSVKLDRGEWVCVVGWLEGDAYHLVKKVRTSATYAPPIPIILEAIHISPSREPPIGAMYRGSTSNIITTDHVSLIGETSFEEDIDHGYSRLARQSDVDITPKPKRRKG